MVKEFRPTYLYVKTHTITGLKYFGKTCRDPFTYRGSGIYWLRHLRKHGNYVTTEIIGYFTDKDECVNTAISFSQENDIVYATNEANKKIWANQILENGLDGGITVQWIRTNEYRKRMSEHFKGRVVSEETRQLLRERAKNRDMSHMRRPKSEEWKRKISESSKNRLPMSEDTKQKMSESRKGKPRSLATREKLRIARTGFKHSEDALRKMRGIPCSDEKRQRLREFNLGKQISDEVKQKLSGYVCVINLIGELRRMPKDEFYNQSGKKEEWEWVAHNSAEGKRRKNKSISVPIIDQEQAIEISRMRRG